MENQANIVQADAKETEAVKSFLSRLRKDYFARMDAAADKAPALFRKKVRDGIEAGKKAFDEAAEAALKGT